MMFRRAPSAAWAFNPPQVLVAYRCESCDVLAAGERCWCCGGPVVATPSLWTSGRS